MRLLVRTLVLSLLLVLWTGQDGRAASDVVELKWNDLVPVDTKPVEKKLKNLFSGAVPLNPPGSLASGAGGNSIGLSQPFISEGRWMAKPRHQPGAGRPAQIVAALDGKRIRIGGYVVPLDFDATTVKDFLLVPFVGACIHVPPPPANQIIHVVSETGFEVGGTFDPVWVTGTIRAETSSTGLAETGYSINAETVEARPE